MVDDVPDLGEDEQVMAVAGDVPDPEADERAQPPLPPPFRPAARVPTSSRGSVSSSQIAISSSCLLSEVVVEGAGRETEVVGELRDRGLRVAALREDAGRAGDDVAASPFPALPQGGAARSRARRHRLQILTHSPNDHSDFERSFGILACVPGPPDLSPLLIANRGEIAVRVARTAHGLGLRTIAVFTDADRGAVHAEAADVALHVPSYLDSAAIVAAASAAGARSVHPGYGFLSENAEFASAVVAAGLAWVGPPAESIALMGDKGRAKQLATEAGVPVVPGTAGTEADAEAIAALAGEHGYPIVIKALAGGGGKGMRVVRSERELEGAIAAARREAEAAFGDGRVLAERYLERPRHIEIQVLADGHGNVVHLGERECSLQRRHQKVIEEAPSPVVGTQMRERMGAAACDLARACGYEGAGTVEFIVSGDTAPGDEGAGFYFLEMNTRLQVEHPVTEMVWGVDLVEQQLRAAAGEPLRFEQSDLEPRGHAIEARLYSEDPAAGFLPAIGTVRRLRLPEGPGVRVDAGIAEGSVIGADYDPMLGKVIAHGPDRETAIGRLDRALAGLVLLGVAHNAAFSRELIASRGIPQRPPRHRAARADSRRGRSRPRGSRRPAGRRRAGAVAWRHRGRDRRPRSVAASACRDGRRANRSRLDRDRRSALRRCVRAGVATAPSPSSSTASSAPTRPFATATRSGSAVTASCCSSRRRSRSPPAPT